MSDSTLDQLIAFGDGLDDDDGEPSDTYLQEQECIGPDCLNPIYDHTSDECYTVEDCKEWDRERANA